MYFVTPIQPVTISITGFSMDPLPDLDLIDGKSEVVFDLDQYVDTLFADVVWTNSRLSEISTFIDEETNEVSAPVNRGLSIEEMAYGTSSRRASSTQSRSGFAPQPTCRVCSAPNPVGERFCTNCGSDN